MNCNSVFILSSYSSSSSYVRSILFALLCFFSSSQHDFKTSRMLLVMSFGFLCFSIFVFFLFVYMRVVFFSFSIPSSAFTILLPVFLCIPIRVPDSFASGADFQLLKTHNTITLVLFTKWDTYIRRKNPNLKFKLFERNVLSMRQKTFHKQFM